MSRRALTILLFVSLAVNLFALGALVGVGLWGGRMIDGHHRHMRLGGPIGAAAEALRPGNRDAFRAALREEAASAGPRLRQARQLRREAWLKLAADPVDPAAVQQDLDRARALESGARAQIDRRIVTLAASMPADERGRLGKALAPPMGHDGRQGPPPPDGPPAP